MYMRRQNHNGKVSTYQGFFFLFYLFLYGQKKEKQNRFWANHLWLLMLNDHGQNKL